MTQNPRSARRVFLNRASAAAAALGAATTVLAKSEKTIRPGVSARSAARVVGANDRVHLGMIGMGGMGTVHLQAFMKQTEEEKDIQIVATSDTYTRRKQRAGDNAKLTANDHHRA